MNRCEGIWPARARLCIASGKIHPDRRQLSTALPCVSAILLNLIAKRYHFSLTCRNCTASRLLFTHWHIAA